MAWGRSVARSGPLGWRGPANTALRAGCSLPRRLATDVRHGRPKLRAEPSGIQKQATAADPAPNASGLAAPCRAFGNGRPTRHTKLRAGSRGARNKQSSAVGEFEAEQDLNPPADAAGLDTPPSGSFVAAHLPHPSGEGGHKTDGAYTNTTRVSGCPPQPQAGEVPEERSDEGGGGALPPK